MLLDDGLGPSYCGHFHTLHVQMNAAQWLDNSTLFVESVQLLKRVEKDLEDYGTVEQFPKMEGRQLVMVMAPKKK